MNTTTKTTKAPQIVVNVTKESKEEISLIKEKYNVSDKEFVAAVLVILKGTSDDVINAAVKTVTAEKEKAKLAAKIAKIEATLAKVKAEAETSTEEVVYSAEDEVEAVA